MFKKVFCALLCVVLMLSLCACSNSPVIATYEGDPAAYSTDEIKLLLAQNGFETLAELIPLTLEKPDKNSEKVLFLSKSLCCTKAMCSSRLDHKRS